MSATNVNDRHFRQNKVEELGQHVGQLKSVTERLELGLILVGLAIGGLLWHFSDLSRFLVPQVSIGCILALYFGLLRHPFFNSVCDIYERGMSIKSRDKHDVFPFQSVLSMRSTHTHHKMNHAYVATKFELEMMVELPTRNVKYQCDYSKDGNRAQTIGRLLERISGAVTARLWNELKQSQELPWRNDISLTLQGIKLDAGQDYARLVPFTEIEEFCVRDNELKIWRQGDAMPFVVLKNDSLNFSAMYGLFSDMLAQTKRITESAEPVEGGGELRRVGR